MSDWELTTTVLLKDKIFSSSPLACHEITGTQSPPSGRACPRRARRAAQWTRALTGSRKYPSSARGGSRFRPRWSCKPWSGGWEARWVRNPRTVWYLNISQNVDLTTIHSDKIEYEYWTLIFKSEPDLIILSKRVVESFGNSEPAKDKQESGNCLRYTDDLL